MKNSLLVLFALAAFCSCSFLSNPFAKGEKGQNLRLLENYSTQKGNVPLVMKNGSFFVHVDFVNHEQEASDSDKDNQDYGNMMPALYTDKTFFGKECQGFTDYCSKYGDRCKEIIKPLENFVFPYFQSGGKSIISEVYLDYGHWRLKTSAMISAGCDGFYKGGYGLLGMGFDGDSLINYLTAQPSFAVNIARNHKNGTLSFKKDLSKVKSSTPVSKVTSDSNWRISGVKSMTIGKSTHVANLSVIFDLGTPSIGFPLEDYKTILNTIQKHPGVGKCQAAQDFTVTCNFTGDIRKLPSIYLELAGEKLTIPPEAYVVHTQDSPFYENSIELRLKPLSTDSSKGIYVTPSHENYVILGYSMMSYFYTVFDGGHKSLDPLYNVKPSISLYYSAEFESSNKYLPYLIGAGVAGFIVIGMVFYCFAKCKEAKKGKQAPLLDGENHENLRSN